MLGRRGRSPQLLLRRQRTVMARLPWTTRTTTTTTTRLEEFKTLTRTFSLERNDEEYDGTVGSKFKVGDQIQIEVVSFGPLGASVEVISQSHDPDDLIPDTEPALARGLILQKEIHYFRQARNNVDVVQGEILPAYVERIREDGRLDIGLRAFGGKAKAGQVAAMILDRLEWADGGILQIGDKSSPAEINAEFPGVSKGTFKKAVSALYKQGKVKPGAFSIEPMNP